MKSRWSLIVTVVVAHLAVALVSQRWGLKVTLLSLAVVALVSWVLYTYSVRGMDRVYTEYLYFDEEMKKEFMAHATAEVRAEIEKREREEKNA